MNKNNNLSKEDIEFIKKVAEGHDYMMREMKKLTDKVVLLEELQKAKTSSSLQRKALPSLQRKPVTPVTPVTPSVFSAPEPDKNIFNLNLQFNDKVDEASSKISIEYLTDFINNFCTQAGVTQLWANYQK